MRLLRGGVSRSVLGGSLVLGSFMGAEFIPRLDEGTISVQAWRLPSVSLEESIRQSALVETNLRRFPEVVTVVSRTGRAEIATDPHGVEISGERLFYAHIHLHGGPAPVRRFLPELINLVWERKINPGKVFDLTLPLDRVAEGYRAMDERRAIKTLLCP